jgi:hypothetical protein
MPTVETPFALIYSELKRFVWNHPSRPELVQPGNLIVFDTPNPAPGKPKIQAADLPELQLLPDGGSVVIESNDSHAISHRFVWWLTTGDQRASEDKGLFSVEWMLIEATIQANYALSGEGGPQWRGLSFVESVAIVDLAEALNDRTKNRGIRGWSAVLAIEVRMSIPTQFILANQTQS